MVLDLKQETGKTSSEAVTIIKSKIVDALAHCESEGLFPEMRRDLVITTVADKFKYTGTDLVDGDDWTLRNVVGDKIWYAEDDGSGNPRHQYEICWIHPQEWNEDLVGARPEEISSQPFRWSFWGNSLYVYPATPDASHYLVVPAQMIPPSVGKELNGGGTDWTFTDTTDGSDLGAGDVTGDLFSVRPGGLYHVVMAYALYLCWKGPFASETEAQKALMRYSQAERNLARYRRMRGPKDKISLSLWDYASV